MKKRIAKKWCEALPVASVYASAGMPLTFGSLFAGIGGIDLGFERAGMVCKWQVEIDPYSQKVLAKHWPNVRRHDDIRTWPQPDTERVDVICGGFPCQDISYAGKGAGLTGDRSGLFYELMRIVRDMGPGFVVLENVSALLTRGVDSVLGSLASLGFDAEWHCFPAAAFGAPHIRDRAFILAHASRELRDGIWIGTEQAGRREPTDCGWWEAEPAVGGNLDGFPNFLDRHIGRGLSYAESQRAVEGLRNVWDEHVAKTIQREAGGLGRVQTAEILFALMREYAKGGRVPRQFVAGKEALGDELRYLRRRELASSTPQGREPDEQFSGEYPNALCDMPRKIALWDAFESGIDRVTTGVPRRVDRLRGLGNAVVPQVAQWIGARIVAAANDADYGATAQGNQTTKVTT